MMKLQYSVTCLLGSLFLIAANASFAETVIIEKAIAVVDTSVVLQSDFNERKTSILQRLQGQRDQLPPDDILNTQILDQLILEQLQVTEAGRYGITISDQQINATIQNIMQNNGHKSLEELSANLATDGLTLNHLREKMRREHLISQVQSGVVNGRIRITDQEIDNFLDSSDGKSAISPDYRLGHILISAPASAGADATKTAEEKALSLFQQLQEGADFASLAITHSNDQTALDGGELGWRKFSQLPEIFADAVEPLKVGEVSKPIRSGAGFHLLKNIEQRGGGEQLVDQTLARHILIKTSEIMDDDTAQAKLKKLKIRIEAGGDFSKLARENSEDIGSMLNGGDLGWASAGMFVPAFDKAMNETGINDITSPFQSKFGWHILQVLERRKEDMSDLVVRNKAAQLLRERRFDEELLLWQMELRENAFIDIKDAS